jgi:transglutaminase-like putative cysteine protease
VDKRVPTVDEAAGMRWWNELSEAGRARALASASTAVAAVAWDYHKALMRWLEKESHRPDGVPFEWRAPDVSEATGEHRP